MVQMRLNRFTRWFLLAVSLLTFSAMLYLGRALAQHNPAPFQQPSSAFTLLPDRIIPPPNLPSGGVALMEYGADTAIRNNVAVTTITQTYRNTSDRTLEVRYLFPLPPDAAPSGLTLTVDGKTLEGRILEKEQARETYRDIVRRMIDPGLLEYLDDRTIQASVGPFRPGESKQIKLSYTQLLRQDGGFRKYVYRLGSRPPEEIRQYPGRPPHILPVTPMSDMSRQFSGAKVPRTPTADILPVPRPPEHMPRPSPPPRPEFHLKVSLIADRPLKTLYSPTHDPKITRESPEKAVVTLTVKPDEPNPERNFVFYYSQADQELGLSTLDYRAEGEDGYFLLALHAPDSVKNRTATPKDIVLALDTSGSMSGSKLEQAKTALKYVIDHLHPGDRFGLLQFNTDVSSLQNGLISATPENRRRALDYVDSLQAEGSTHLEAALRTAFGWLKQRENALGRQTCVILLTDGEPTVGVTDMDGLVKIADQANTQHARLFSFGVGYDLNAVLLGKLSDHNHGSTTFVEPNENLEQALTAFYRKMEYPVLTDVKLRAEGVTLSRLYPETPGDLFVGSEVLILGRYTGGNQGVMVLSGRSGAETRTFRQPFHWTSGTQHAQLPRLWAGRRIAWLLEAIRQNGENAELRDEVIALSKRYGIITPYTAFLAAEPEEMRRPPAGNGGFPGPVPGMPTPLASPQAMRRETGRDAVQFSKALNAMKKQASVAGLNASQAAGGAPSGSESTGAKVRIVENKTFLRSTEGVWTDTAYDAHKHGPPTRVVFGTEAYFKLLTEKPALSPYFGLGPQVLVVLPDGRAYESAMPSAP